MDSNQDKLNFLAALSKKIEFRTRQKISNALLEIFASSDIIIASSLGMDTHKTIYDAAISEINKRIKEDGGIAWQDQETEL